MKMAKEMHNASEVRCSLPLEGLRMKLEERVLLDIGNCSREVEHQNVVMEKFRNHFPKEFVYTFADPGKMEGKKSKSIENLDEC